MSIESTPKILPISQMVTKTTIVLTFDLRKLKYFAVDNDKTFNEVVIDAFYEFDKRN